jgi:LemA protein
VVLVSPTGLGALIAGGAVLLVLLVLVVASHNRFVRQRNLVEESWRQVDVELVRRHDLVPNLVAVVKGYAAHERALFEHVARARWAAGAQGGTVGQRSGGEAELTYGLRHLFALGEAYPALRADRNFLALQWQLAETEDRIAAARRFYNGNVRALNTRIESFPTLLVASLFGFAKAEYFLTDEAQVRAVPVAAPYN